MNRQNAIDRNSYPPLDELLPAGVPTAASVWVRQLGESFPVFETGWVRRRVRDTESSWPAEKVAE
jgi:hypothetical protein